MHPFHDMASVRLALRNKSSKKFWLKKECGSTYIFIDIFNTFH